MPRTTVAAIRYTYDRMTTQSHEIDRRFGGGGKDVPNTGHFLS